MAATSQTSDLPTAAASSHPAPRAEPSAGNSRVHGWTRAWMFMLVPMLAAVVPVQAQPAASRGELLYTTHCIECHTAQMHWRTLRLARDWDTLKAQVRRWQDVARLNWDEQDVEAVTRYLNDSIYDFPRTEQVSRAAR